MNEIKVSVIMPVYNSEKYLRETLNSVLNQSFQDFELIAVNDGSTDKSKSILLEFENKFSNFKILNQMNKGVSAARNYGLEFSIGKYCTFLDADDFIDRDYLKILFDTASRYQTDIVVCDYYTFYDNTSSLEYKGSNEHYEYKYKELVGIYGKSAFDYAMSLGVGTSPCIKLYKIDLLRHNNIKFDTKTTYGEDMFFNWKAFLVANSIYLVPKKLYGYRQNNNGATSKYHPNLFSSYMREFDNLRCFAKDTGTYNSDLEISIQCNLAQRIRSFLRMDIRKKGSLIKKYKFLTKTVNQQELQDAVDIYIKYNDKNDVDSFYFWIKKKNSFIIFCNVLYNEARQKLVKKLRNRITRNRIANNLR